MSDQEKQIDVGGNKFTIKKFTPKLACYWAFQILGSLATGMDGNYIKAIQDFIQMTPERFEHFQKDCLQYCYFTNESGTHSVVNREGNIAYPGDITGPQLMQMIIQTFGFTLMDFLGEGQKGEALAGISELFQTDGSATSSTSPSPKGTGSKKSSGTEPTT